MATPLTVMTWNVENLFPPEWHISPRRVVTQAEYDAKLDFLAAKIGEIQPDILAMQELGGTDADAMRTLANLDTRLGNRYVGRAISLFPDGRQIRVAFLSRFAISAQADITAFAAGELARVPTWHDVPITRLGRGALQITVAVGGHTAQLVAVHLKSKLISYLPHPHQTERFAPDSEDERAIGAGLALLRRTAEATAIRVHLNTQMPPQGREHTIVLGDFNDEPRAATSQLVLGPEDQDATRSDSLDHTRLYNVVDTIPRQGGDNNNLHFLPADEQYSRIHKGRGELIDHVLVSRSLLGAAADLRQGRSWVQEVRSRVGFIKGQSVTDDPMARVGQEAPDHAPVYVRIELP